MMESNMKTNFHIVSILCMLGLIGLQSTRFGLLINVRSSRW